MLKYNTLDGRESVWLNFSARRLRSANTATRVTRRTSNIFGDRCFAAAGPRLWNLLPIQLRQCHSLKQLKRLLETFLFCAWSHGALWDLLKLAPFIILLTYLLTDQFSVGSGLIWSDRVEVCRWTFALVYHTEPNTRIRTKYKLYFWCQGGKRWSNLYENPEIENSRQPDRNYKIVVFPMSCSVCRIRWQTKPRQL